jgi:hypothetical protein
VEQHEAGSAAAALHLLDAQVATLGRAVRRSVRVVLEGISVRHDARVWAEAADLVEVVVGAAGDGLVEEQLSVVRAPR